MKKFASSTNRKFGFIRLLSITAVVLTAAIFINALPNLTAQAASSGSFFGLANLFSQSADDNAAAPAIALADSTDAPTAPPAITNYAFSATTGVALEDMTGATQIVASNVDDAPSATQLLPFNFFFMGAGYTRFCASPDGWVRLMNANSAACVSEFTNSLTSTTNTPKLSAYWDDLATGTDGNVSFKTVGTAPNRKLVVQWFVTVPRLTTGAANATFQAWAFEGTGVIQYVYGAIGTGTSYSVGLTQNATSFASVTTATDTNSYVTANNANTAAFVAGDSYTYTPPQITPNAPTNLTFTNITLSSVTLNWIDNSTNEVAFPISISTDGGATFSFIGSAPENATSQVITGLTPNTTYFFRVQAATEGVASAPASGSVTTSMAPPPLNGTYTVPGNFPSLTNPGGIFEALNTSGATGTVNINITADLAGETGAIALNELPGVTVVIRPSGGARTITGSSASGLIRFSGTDNVTIDGALTAGGTDRSLTVTNTGTGGVIYFASGTNGAQNNTVKNVNAVGSAAVGGTLLGISFAGNTFGGVGADNDNNRIENNDVRGCFYGIASLGATAANQNTGTVITGNVMPGTGATGIGRVGVYVINEDNIQITQNTIASVANPGSVDTIGIAAGSQALGATPPASGAITNALISRNNIGVVSNNATFSAAGIVLTSGATGTNTVVNNFVSGVIANADSGDIAAGIYVVPVAGATQNIYFNSVSMTGDRGAGANQFPSFALVVTADQPTNVLNNILFNTQTRTGSTGGGGESVAFGILPATFVNINSNFNDLFVSGPNGVVGLTGGLSSTAQTPTAGTGVVRATLADFQAATGKDANSLSVNPVFVSTTDLHLQSTSPVRNAGTPIAGVTTDIDGNTRDATPDIGADEFLSLAGTLNFGSATYTVNENTPATITVNRTTGNLGTVTVQVSITGGTATGGAACTAGVDYINTGFPQTLTFVNGDVTESFNVTLCPDAVLDDNETIIFTLSNPTGGATIGAINQTTVTINDVAPPLNGNFNVPGNFPSLTNPGGIFEALNTSGASGAVNINITADLTGETGEVELNAIAGSPAITIRPTGGSRTITSTPTAGTLIGIIGADNVTINGDDQTTAAVDRGLTFNLTNTTTSGTTVFFIGSQGAGAGATNFTLQNSTVQAGDNGSDGSPVTFGIFVGDQSGSPNGADNDNLTIQNNLIQRVTIGIQAIGVAGTGVNDNTVIVDNTLGGTAATDFLGRVGINVGQAQNARVTRNTVNNILNSAASNVQGIVVGAGTLNSTVTRNRITNLNATNAGGYGAVGVLVSTGTAASGITVANNFISDIKGTTYIPSIPTDTNAGIMIAGATGGINIYYNSVNLFGDYAGFNGATITGALSIVTATVTDLNIRNNIFVNSFDNTTVTTDRNFAIYSVPANTAFTDINYNDYFVSGPQGVLGSINGVDVTTLAALQAATAKDANSISANPLFVSPTDLHISSAASPVSNAGTPIAGITVDFDNQTRSATTPDIGADELIAPTAASVDIGGRVREANGRGIFRARVTMTDSTGNVRMAFTNQFGYFRFSNVAAGNTYVFSATDRRYQFTEPTQVLFINEATEGISFTASGENPGFRPEATFFDNAPFDFDGDGRTDVSVFRNSDNTWYINRSSDNTLFAQAFGAAGDRLAPADFDGDGKTDLAVFRPSEGNWYIWLSASNSLRVEQFGTELDRAIPADFDGDGKADFSIWNEMRGTWQVKLSTNGTIVTERFNNGKGNFTPLVSDRDGDGKADFIFFNNLNATWTIRTSAGANVKEQFGAAGDRAAMGDFDGDAQGDLAVYRASDNTWTISLANGKELNELRLSANADNPVLGDFDGDGSYDAAGFGNGVWSVRQSVNGAVRQQQFGLANDVVIPSPNER